ncbi:MAG: CapA family protein [Candidatus Curtissbacteria bacterium]|nr:CapA family protein [Candidatus Curtissbacteria bacterium]
MKILFVGDVMLGRLVNGVLRHNPPAYIWGDILPTIKSANIKICNLECVIANVGKPWPNKTFHFRTDPKNVQSLNIANFSPISISNNHAMDFGPNALMQMIDIFKKESINFAGAGIDITEAFMPALENGAGNYVGMISFCDNMPQWEAAKNKPGIFYVPVDLKDRRAKRLLELVKKTRDDVKILIVSAHWGSNWGYDVPKNHTPFAHALIDAGADIIFGHSGHVFRGVEIYKGKLIIYCAGNFVDDYAVNDVERNDESFIFILDLDVKRSRIKKLTLTPTIIDNCQALLASKDRAEIIAQKMQNLSKKLGTVFKINQKDFKLTLIL